MANLRISPFIRVGQDHQGPQPLLHTKNRNLTILHRRRKIRRRFSIGDGKNDEHML